MAHTVKTRGFEIVCDEHRVFKLNGKRCKFVGEHSRRVYECGDYIIKIDGWDEQNPIEWETWQSIAREDRKFFAKVLAYKQVDDEFTPFSILIQRKVKGRKTNHNVMVRLARSIGEKYNLTDFGGFQNFVVVTAKDGTSYPVIFDMGM
jgi:hypothetical protein